MTLKINYASETISSRTNPLIARVCKLEDKKYREDERLFRLDGIKLLREALDFGADIEYILIREDSFEKIIGEIDDHLGGREIISKGTLVKVGSSAFEKMSTEKAPEGVITVVKYIDKIRKICKIENNSDFFPKGKTLLIESVRDPGNLGTMLRTAAAFGIENVITTTDCADIYNQKTIRAAMGAVFKLKIIRIESVTEAIRALQSQNRRILAAALDRNAVRLGDFGIEKTDVFLIGNEGKGLSKEAIFASDMTVFIPMADSTESLNAAVAASVCMWEMSKI